MEAPSKGMTEGYDLYSEAGIELSGKKSDVNSLQMPQKTPVPPGPKFTRTVPSVQTQRSVGGTGVDQRRTGSLPRRPFCLYVGYVWSNRCRPNLNISLTHVINNKCKFIVL